MRQSLTDALERKVRERQRDWRSPGLAVGVVQDGELSWSLGVGASDVGRPDDPPARDTAFAIGSITKTFTATMIMMLRDEGKLALTDRLGDYVPAEAPRPSVGAPHTAASRHSDLTLRELLAHASGLQREPVGDVWDTLVMPDIDAVVRDLDAAERVLPARLRWHYSNLGYALLGEVVARIDGRPWAEALQARVLDPLGMSRTSLRPSGPTAVGYYADPFADRVHEEPWTDMAAFSAAGGLWSTLDDLARWCTFLIRGADGVLSADTIDEMSRPEIMTDLDNWTLAWGLGLELLRRGERIMVGHEGAMPGFLAGLVVRRPDKTGAIVLSNTSAGADVAGLALDVLTTVLDAEPPAVAPWRPGAPVPDELAPLVGRWWSEGDSFTFSVRDGHLEARKDGQPASKAPAVFEAVGPDRYRTVSGREQGELLRVERDGEGAVSRMFWATYPFTRDPRTFGS